jgi:hypothetical protein
MYIHFAGSKAVINQHVTSDLRIDFASTDKPSPSAKKLHELLTSFPRQVEDHTTLDQQS